MTETAEAARPSARRKKRLGDGMLTPTEVLEFRNPQTGRVEQLLPGRDCVSADWFGYKLHPELFRVVNRGDADTADRHRETLERTRRRLGTTTRADTRPRQKFSLGPDRPRREFRLP